jgi:hypothetical protein
MSTIAPPVLGSSALGIPGRPAEHGVRLPDDFEHRVQQFAERVALKAEQHAVNHGGRPALSYIEAEGFASFYDFAFHVALWRWLDDGEVPATHDENEARLAAEAAAEEREQRRRKNLDTARAVVRRVPPAKSLCHSFFRLLQARTAQFAEHQGIEHDEYRHAIVSEVMQGETDRSKVLLDTRNIDALAVACHHVEQDMEDAGIDMGALDAEYQERVRQRLEAHGEDGAGGFPGAVMRQERTALAPPPIAQPADPYAGKSAAEIAAMWPDS